MEWFFRSSVRRLVVLSSAPLPHMKEREIGGGITSRYVNFIHSHMLWRSAEFVTSRMHDYLACTEIPDSLFANRLQCIMQCTLSCSMPGLDYSALCTMNVLRHDSATVCTLRGVPGERGARGEPLGQVPSHPCVYCIAVVQGESCEIAWSFCSELQSKLENHLFLRILSV